MAFRRVWASAALAACGGGGSSDAIEPPDAAPDAPACEVSFAAPSRAFDATSITTGDFDGDGLVDIAGHRRGEPLLDIAFGAGTTRMVSVGADTLPADALASGDLDGDGVEEIVSLSRAGLTVVSTNTIAQTAVDPNLMGASCCLALADMTGDAKPDAIFFSYYRGAVIVMPGLGDGRFGNLASALGSAQPGTLVTADIDVDGDLDVLVSMPLVLFDNPGTGSVSARPYLVAEENPRRAGLVVTDLDGDGQLDILIAGSGSPRWLTGHGDGTFADPVASGIGEIGHPLLARDIDANGLVDIVGATTTEIAIAVQVSADDFTLVTMPVANAQASRPELADLNGDGALDLVTTDGVRLRQPCE